MSEWGNPAGWRPVNDLSLETQGTETSKYLEEKRTIVIPLVVASENGTALKCHNFYWNVFGKRNQRRWKSCTGKELWYYSSMAGPVKPCLKVPAPSGKAKYSWETDSEPVPWGKGEKNPK